MVKYSVADQSFVLEGKSIREAISPSWDITRGHCWRIWGGVYVFIGLPCVFVTQKPTFLSWIITWLIFPFGRRYFQRGILEIKGVAFFKGMLSPLAEAIKTENPGYIVYEDEYQITAEPFNTTDT